YWLDSPLRFSSQREKKRLVNFQKFFSFAVNHPRALPLVRLLIKLPANKLFILFSRVYDVWRIGRLTRAKFTLGGFVAAVKINLQYIFTYFR
ncbi:MAG: hypothetical protein HQ595_01865, partial [Candidatus Omnitrophica bacterium]|nr:hypothetical protein [Candidatus Omnitrophota bacterium]